MWWSWVLTAIGVTGLYLVTRKDWRGYVVGVGVQLLWIAYAISTRQWGFIVSACVYGAVNWLGLYRWRFAKPKPVKIASSSAFADQICGCKHRAADHQTGGWGNCLKCVCTDGIYHPWT